MLLVLLKVYTFPCHDRGHINVVLVLQSCSDSLHILPSSSCDTNAASSDFAYHIGNMKVEDDVDMQGVEGVVNVKTEKVGNMKVEDDVDMQGVEGVVNVKTEKGIASEEEECICVKVEEGIHSEEEEDDDIDIKEEEGVGIKEEVSLKVQRNKC